MAKYKVLKEFRDIHTKKVYKKGQTIAMTEKRAKEAAENLKQWGKGFFEPVIPEKDPEKETKVKKSKGEGK